MTKKEEWKKKGQVGVTAVVEFFSVADEIQ